MFEHTLTLGATAVGTIGGIMEGGAGLGREETTEELVR